MEKLSSIIVLLMVCTAPLAQALSRRSLLDGAFVNTGSSSSSSSGGSATSTSNANSNGGTATAFSSATGSATAEARGALVSFFEAVKINLDKPSSANSDECTSAVVSIKNNIVAAGVAIARAYAAVSTQTSVTGSGSACASAQASAQADASAFVEVIVEAYLSVSNAVAEADVRAIASGQLQVFVAAFANAYATACSGSDSSAFAFQTVIAKAVARPVVSIAIQLFAGVNCDPVASFSGAFGSVENEIQDEITSVNNSGGTGVNGQGGSSSSGSGGAISTAELCSGNIRNQCCGSGTVFCTCNGLCDATRVLTGPDFYQDNDTGNICRC